MKSMDWPESPLLRPSPARQNADVGAAAGRPEPVRPGSRLRPDSLRAPPAAAGRKNWQNGDVRTVNRRRPRESFGRTATFEPMLWNRAAGLWIMGQTLLKPHRTRGEIA